MLYVYAIHFLTIFGENINELRISECSQGVSYSSAQKRKSMKVCFMGFRSQDELTKSAEVWLFTF